MLVETFLVAPGTMELARLPIHTHSEQACELSCHTAVSPRDRTASWDLISSVPPLRHVVEALRTCYATYRVIPHALHLALCLPSI
jgi:hypothetical protein